MSDEHEDNPQGAHFVFPFNLGPSKEQVEQMQMHQEANAHETRHFFDSLDEGQLRKLSGLFQACYQSDGDASQYFIGIIAGMLDQKFKVCLACGRNHDAELKDFAPAEEEELPQKRAAEETIELMKQYDVEILISGSLVCKNCETPIASLEDRMLRPPGTAGCPGCVEKEKWG